MTLLCAVCAMTRDEPDEADVIVAGTSVCLGHVGYVQDGTLSRAITLAGGRRPQG